MNLPSNECYFFLLGVLVGLYNSQCQVYLKCSASIWFSLYSLFLIYLGLDFDRKLNTASRSVRNEEISEENITFTVTWKINWERILNWGANKVPRKYILTKLESHGINGYICNWVEDWLRNRKQRVVVIGKESPWEDVCSIVPQAQYSSQYISLSISITQIQIYNAKSLSLLTIQSLITRAKLQKMAA